MKAITRKKSRSEAKNASVTATAKSAEMKRRVKSPAKRQGAINNKNSLLQQMYGRLKRRLNNGDFTIIITTTILIVIGICSVFSASYYNSISIVGHPFYFAIKQIVYAILGLILMAMILCIDYKILKKQKIANIIMGITTVALLLTIFGLGTTVNGATRWIYIGPIAIMPGEIAKLSMIIWVSAFVANRPVRAKKLQDLIFIAAVTGIVCLLIMKQPNMSIAMTIIGIVAAILFVAGLPKIYMLIAGGGVVTMAFFLAVAGGGYRMKRITSFLDPFSNSLGDAFQVVQSLLALGSGGVKGVGLGESVAKTMYLPEPHNDFILAIIGEELGLWGVLLLMLVYMILIYKGLKVAIQTRDMFSMLLAAGITAMIALQVILNIAVVTSSMPPTGVTLPFISYGGNALWLFMAAVAILISISAKNKEMKAIERRMIKEDEEALRRQMIEM